MENAHRKHEQRSLLMHRLVADRLRQSPSDVVRFGLNNLQRWQKAGVDCEDFSDWDRLLHSAPERILETLESEDEDSCRLRQSSPFAGLVSEEERSRIFAAIP
jgi:Arc/MetJ-type ribon-helix-helix transcriptional regulator